MNLINFYYFYKAKKKTIIFAEKNPSHGTQVLFERFFKTRFEPTNEFYPITLNSEPVSVHYLNLSKVAYDENYSKNWKSMMKETMDVWKIICFEYCAPRVDSFPQNMETMNIFFYSDEDFMPNMDIFFYAFMFEGKKSKDELMPYLKNFELAKRIQNFESKVFIFDTDGKNFDKEIFESSKSFLMNILDINFRLPNFR